MPSVLIMSWWWPASARLLVLGPGGVCRCRLAQPIGSQAKVRETRSTGGRTGRLQVVPVVGAQHLCLADPQLPWAPLRAAGQRRIQRLL